MKKLIRPVYLKETGYNIVKGDFANDPSIQAKTEPVEKHQQLSTKKYFPQSYGNTLGLSQPVESVRNLVANTETDSL